MPIASTQVTTDEVTYTFASIALDLQAGTCDVRLQVAVNGVPTTHFAFSVDPITVQKLLGTMPGAGLNRADDLAAMVYNYAVQSALINGTVY